MKGDRMAEDDVSKYTTRKKKESREGEEKRRMRKGRKRGGKGSGRSQASNSHTLRWKRPV
jgi:hypothetical protein